MKKIRKVLFAGHDLALWSHFSLPDFGVATLIWVPTHCQGEMAAEELGRNDRKKKERASKPGFVKVRQVNPESKHPGTNLSSSVDFKLSDTSKFYCIFMHQINI